MDDLDDLLCGVEGTADLGGHRPLLDGSAELADHRERDVGVEKGDADLADGFVDVGLGQPALAAQVAEGRRQAIGQAGEHRVLEVWAREPGHPDRLMGGRSQGLEHGRHDARAIDRIDTTAVGPAYVEHVDDFRAQSGRSSRRDEGAG